MKKSLSTKIALAAALIVVAGCGESDGNSSTGDGGMPSTVEIGALYPFTGPAAFVGEEVRAALDIWAEEFNGEAAESGLPKVKFKYEDSQASASVAVKAYQKMQSGTKVPIVISSYTNVLSAFAPFATREDVAVLQAGQGSNVTNLGPTVSQLLVGYQKQMTQVMPEVIKAGVKTIATVAVSDNEAFVIEADRMKKEFCPELGCEVVAQATMASDASDAAAAATKVGAENPDAVFISGVTTQIVPVATKLKNDGYKGIIIGSTDLDELVTSGHEELIEGAIFGSFFVDEKDPKFVDFAQKFEKKQGHKVPGYAISGYKTGQIIRALLTKMVDENRSWDGKEILKSTLELQDVPTIAGNISFDKDRRIVEEFNIMTIRNGKREVVSQVNSN